MLLNTDRYSPSTTLIKNGVVIHDSEGAEGLLPWGQNSSAQLIAALEAKGDKPSPSRPGGFFGAGYHAVVCEDGTYVQVADASAGPFSAPPCNQTWWHVCIPGRAAQTRDQWLNDVSRQYVRGVARFIVDHQRADGLVWPLTFRSAAELAAADGKDAGHPCGYTTHAQVSQAWHQSDHTDPGVSFPLDVLALDIAALINPTTGDDDMKIYIVSVPGFKAKFIAEGTADGHILSCRWSGPGDAKGQMVVDRHKAKGAVALDASLDDLKPVYLDGALPFGDDRMWTLADFANPE